ncbi:hypothetical protein NQD34_000365 [Periophthalmus magnuspinnatus]|nr:hypothetical protein NQD34_000365 [Periophthalmus magnuspinnatus]
MVRFFLTNRTEPGCQMIVAATMCESSLAFCESENTKDHDYSIVNHHYAEEELTRGRTAGQVCATVCKGHTDSDLRQTSDQQQKLEHQHNQTEAEASSSNSENYEPAQKPHLDKEQLLSRSECHFTATLSLVADSLYESQNPELQTTKIHLDGPSEPDPTAEFSNTNQKNMMNEHEPQKEVKVAVIDKHENKNADEDHSHSENSNTKTNPIKEASKEQEPLHQLDTCNNTFLETFDQIIGENSHLLHTSLSDVPETNCSSMDKGHMNSICEEKEQHDINCSTVCMEPPQSREYVSDSQLNTIDMTDQVMGVITRVSPECYEDVTDLVGGLIRELSSLNRMVMATHRELENLRRRAKSSKNTLR